MATIRFLHPYISDRAISDFGKKRFLKTRVRRMEIELKLSMSGDHWRPLFHTRGALDPLSDGKCQKCNKVVARVSGSILEMTSLKVEPGAVGFVWKTISPYPDEYYNRGDCYHFACAEHVKEMKDESFDVYGFRINPESSSIPYFVFFEYDFLKYLHENNTVHDFTKCMITLFREYDDTPWHSSFKDNTIRDLASGLVDDNYYHPSWFYHSKSEKMYSAGGIKRYAAGEWGGKEYAAIGKRQFEFETFVKGAMGEVIGIDVDRAMEMEVNKDKRITAKVLEISKLKCELKSARGMDADREGKDEGYKLQDLKTVKYHLKTYRSYLVDDGWKKVPIWPLTKESATEYANKKIAELEEKQKKIEEELEKIQKEIKRIEEYRRDEIKVRSKKLRVEEEELKDMQSTFAFHFKDNPPDSNDSMISD